MNEGRQITKEQAEACMRVDSEFLVKHSDIIYSANEFGMLGFWRDGSWRRVVGANTVWAEEVWGYTIHADPNDTFGRLFGEERELTFEEVGAALFRREIVKVIFPDKADALIKLAIERGQLEVHESNDNGKTWGQGFLPDDKWKYTLYKEPTPQPEPLSLESLDARLRKLEGNS